MGGRGTASGLASSAPQAAAPAPARASGLVSDTGVQNMDDAQLTTLIQRALSAPRAADGRDNTAAQRIADALGITQNVPESVRQEALAQYRSQSGANGLMYRTVNDIPGGKTARQIAHELTDHADNYGWNYGGGRAYGTGIYFAAQGSGSYPGEAANHSAQGYGRPGRNPYTIEARLKPTAKIATDSALSSTKAKQWALAHKGALSKIGLSVATNGLIRNNNPGMSGDDVKTTVAMLMGYDGYKESSRTSVYHTIFNLGALQVAKGNKYSRAYSGSLT